MTDDTRDMIAVFFGAAYEYDGPGDDFSQSIPWALKLYHDGLTEEHCGDCTSVPMTCARCLAEEWQATAIAFLAALAAKRLVIVPLEPTEAMVVCK